MSFTLFTIKMISIKMIKYLQKQLNQSFLWLVFNESQIGCIQQHELHLHGGAGHFFIISLNMGSTFVDFMLT